MFVSLIPVGAAPAQAADTAGAFEVTGGTSGTDYSYSNGVLTVNDGASITISMASEVTTPISDRIVIAQNATATITLNNVYITPTDAGTSDGYSGIDLGNGATLNLTLSDDSTNEINGGTSTTGLPGPGIHLPEGSTLTINGSGSLEVHGASGNTKGAVGIGGMGSSGYAGGACGNVLILGGTIKVHGGTPTYSMGKQPVDIGGGDSDMRKGGDCNTVIILTPVNSGGGLTIGGGAGSSIGGGNGSNGQGIRPSGNNTYTVWGNVTLPCDITIPQGATVTIPDGASLTVPEGVTLTNTGTIVKEGGTFTNNGTLDGNPLGYPSTVAVSVSGEDVSGQYTADYGTSATLTATITGGNNLSASDGTVTFYRGEASDENKINETPAKVSNGKATTTVSLSGENWTPNADNAYTITAVYTPGESNQLRPGSGYGSLTVQKKMLTASLSGNLTKTYDGTTKAPEETEIKLEGVVSGENVSASSESISYGDANAGTEKTITASNITLNGSDAENYTLSNDTATATGSITPATMTGSVNIVGDATVGKTLTANYSGTPSTGISYQWYRGDTPITDATGTSYTLTADDAGKSVFVCVTASGNYSGSLESKSVSVKKNEQSAPETGTGYKIDYAAETISAENGYELAATKEANDGSAALTVTPGTDVYIRFAETATAYASDWTLVDVPARPAAPANVSGGTEQISGVDSSMEYRAVGSTSWTRCTGTNISNLSDGDYEVRIAATNNSFASEAVQVHVSPYTGRFSYEISTGVGDNSTLSVDRYATEGERVTITVSPDDAYKLDDLSVTAHGKDVELTANGDGTFSFTMPSADVKISSTFAADPDWTEPEEPATDVSDIFIDVAPNAWYKDAVQYAYDNGLMTGTSANEFAPEATTTRAMIVSMLARLEIVTSAEAAGFADVSADDWYATAVNWAASAGVVSGTGAGISHQMPPSPANSSQRC